MLAEAGDSIKRFLEQGITELGDKLGPLLWQFAPTKRFEPTDFEAFLASLPARADGVALRHVVEVRHDSFASPDFIALLRRYQVPVVHALHGAYPGIWDVAGDTVYVRLQTGSDELPAAYPSEVLDQWAARFKTWAAGGAPDDLDLVDPQHPAERTPRQVLAFVIHEGKIRAPAAAEALIQRLKS